VPEATGREIALEPAAAAREIAMAVVASTTFECGYTPVCDDCGIFLCWDISDEEYERDRAFWDSWRCKSCNRDVPMSRARERRLASMQF
jgi:hypothetical protein